MNQAQRYLQYAQRRIADLRYCAPLDLSHGGPIVSFSFDDYPASAREIGAAALESAGVRGTFYLCSGLLGTNGAFGRIDSADGVQALHQQGHEIGCHTANHADAAAARRGSLMSELDENIKAIRQLTGIAPSSFAFPYGRYSTSSKGLTSQRYDSSRTSEHGINSGKADRHRLKATPLYRDTDPASVVFALDHAVQHKACWVIFYTHDVADIPSEWGCTPTLLQAAIEQCLERAIPVLPVGQALARFNSAQEAVPASP